MTEYIVCLNDRELEIHANEVEWDASHLRFKRNGQVTALFAKWDYFYDATNTEEGFNG